MDATLATLSLVGPDSASFLQGQCTSDVLALPEGVAQLSAILTPQGRVLATPWLIKRANGVTLIIPSPQVEILKARLTHYRLRAKVTFDTGALTHEDAHCLATALGLSHPAAIAGDDPRWCGAHIAAGIPWIGVAESDRYVPQMLNLDLLGAISFSKGCYTGQEIVARTQHLGRIKRRLYRLQPVDGAPVSPNAEVRCDGNKIGEIVTTHPDPTISTCLAVLTSDPPTGTLTLAGARALTVLPLPYAMPPGATPAEREA